ncbi:MAG: polysaccharide deacetylase family protein [Pyrinomonadaceae bacterium]|nr:polysaccharide deacetylase family protein [Pyrinomonadaceae bacterium]
MKVANTNKLAILTYHSVDPSGSVVSVGPMDFARQMDCLSERAIRGTSLAEAITFRERMGVWPERVVVLTFDDGFANFYEAAMPVLGRHGFTATVFTVCGHMGGLNDWGPRPEGLGVLPILSWQQAAELARSGIEIGSHTQTHRDLRRCSTAQVEKEMMVSRAEIEKHLGLQPQSFAYPYGGIDPVSRRLAATHFRASCTTELRRANSDPLDVLPRVDMHYLRSRQRFASLLDGQLDQYLAFRRLGRRARRVFFSDSGTL